MGKLSNLVVPAFETAIQMGRVNRLSASLIALSACQTLSGTMVATASGTSSEKISFHRRAFFARKYQQDKATLVPRFCSHENYVIDEYEHLERMVLDCSSDGNNNEETDSEARFAFELETDREFLRHCESSYLLRDFQQRETTVIPSANTCNFDHTHGCFEV